MWPLDIIRKRNQQAAENIAAGRSERVEAKPLCIDLQGCSRNCQGSCERASELEDRLADDLCLLPPTEYDIESPAARNVDHAEWDGPQAGEHPGCS